ncbi:MAG: DUF502 domain-containing protein [Planctomycetota bacterium]|nr:DUF502 domain-containing protein [Planctomycetota bacterium]
MARSGSYYAAKFFRHVMIGVSAIVLIFLPYKLLQLFGFSGLLNRSHEIVAKTGAPPAIGFILTVALCLAAVAAFGWLVMWVVRLQADRIPILRIFTRTADRFDEAFGKEGFGTRTPVVLIAWPNDNVRTIGMLMRQTTDDAGERTVAMVYIPNTPNPLSGIIRVVDAEKLEHTDWTVDDVMALSFSRGALTPQGGAAGPGPTT